MGWGECRGQWVCVTGWPSSCWGEGQKVTFKEEPGKLWGRVRVWGCNQEPDPSSPGGAPSYVGTGPTSHQAIPGQWDQGFGGGSPGSCGNSGESCRWSLGGAGIRKVSLGSDTKLT